MTGSGQHEPTDSTARPGSSPTFDPPPELSPSTVIAGVLALVTVTWLPVLGHMFVYDDGWTLLANGFLRNPQDLWILFTPHAAQLDVPDAFRPTLVIFDVLAYQVLGLSAPAHHAVSLALHVGVCAAAERWLRILGAPVILRAATIATFGLLALHAEVVAVVSYREDLLAALVGLLASIAASKAVRSHGRRAISSWLSASFVAMALAAGAKMSAAALPVVWLMAESLSPWQPRVSWTRRMVAFGLLTAGVALAVAQTLMVFGDVSPYRADETPRIAETRGAWVSIVAASARIHVGYLQQALVPLGLSAEYVERPGQITSSADMLCSAGLGGLAAYGVWCGWKRRRPLVALAILGTLILCIPTSNAFAMPNLRADRFMYLPSLPLCIGLAGGALAIGTRLATRWNNRALMLAPIVGIAIVQGGAAQAHARVYKSDTRLWEIALRRAPRSPRAHAMSGLLLIGGLEESRLRSAVADPALAARIRGHCRNAERHGPRHDLPQACFARLAAALHDWPEAYRRFERALALAPVRQDRYRAALAEVALDLPEPWEGRNPDDLAREHATRGVREHPYSSDLMAVAGRVYHRLGDASRARATYRRARSLRPERWEIVAWGLELALDLGDARGARKLWAEDRKILQEADAATRGSFTTRVAIADRLFSTAPARPHSAPGARPP